MLEIKMKKRSSESAPIMPACRSCQSSNVAELLDYGYQPICNRFLDKITGRERHFPLGLSQCRACGLLQLTEVIPPAELAPRYTWISYNEAEGHLDRMVAEILRAGKIARNAIIYGLSDKDVSTLARLKDNGFRNTFLINPASDLGIVAPGAGIETIQDRFDVTHARAIAARHGQADLVIARHILEHAHDLHRFGLALQALLKPGGYLALEVPDFSIALEHFDYAAIWEEHIVYFTPATFQSAISRLGCKPIKLLNYSYVLENSLIAIARFDNPGPCSPDTATLDKELLNGQNYMQNFKPTRDRLANFLEHQRRERGMIAIYGAGHLAAKFINLLDLKEFIEFVVDDHPRKQGLFMPGSKLPIAGNPALLERGIRLCLLSLNPESEARVIHNNQAYLKAGGQFASIFPASPRALKY